MATKAQNARQPYGLTNEVVDALLNGSTNYDEVFGEGGIYRTLTKRLFERMLGYRNDGTFRLRKTSKIAGRATALGRRERPQWLVGQDAQNRSQPSNH